MVVLVPVVMAAAAIMAVLVMMVVLMAMVMMLMVVVRMAVLIAVGVSVAVGVAFAMAVAMVMMVVVMPVVVIADMGAALRLEGALDRGCGAALPSHQLGHGRAVLHIEGIARDLDEAVAAAEMPGETGEAQGVLRPHLEQGFGRRLHLDEPAVLEPQGIAVVDRGLHVEIEMNLGAALGLQPAVAAVAGLMVERDDVDDAVGLYGGLADDGGDAGHGTVSVCDRVKLR
ncbi:hypothetical protein BB934_04300 [Microvirga ossetica]|uniref:Uncharacterized protein n=1 Tax=Microvirga ossetica TaxID=1882682 RepID=A0A1B2EC29_9HYPH|nr:hypothetical protein BB934_04300 [Microvirga ossetica]